MCPKRKIIVKKGRNKSSGPSGFNKIFCKGFQTNTSSSGIGSISITPSSLGGQRGGEFVEAWQLFRFVDMRILVHPHQSTAAGFYGMGFVAGNATAPTANGQIMSVNKSCMATSNIATIAGTTKPTSLVLNRQDLLADAPNKWWRTQASASIETWEEVQGNLFSFTPDASGVLTYEFWSIIEFSSPVAPSMVPRPLFSGAAMDVIRQVARDEVLHRSREGQCTTSSDSTKGLVVSGTPVANDLDRIDRLESLLVGLLKISE